MAGDELFLLDLKQGENKGVWIEIPVTGPTPGKRYGHSMAYLKPFIVVFGGQLDGSGAANDVWILAIDTIPFKWIKVGFDTEQPIARYYHTSALCQIGIYNNAILIYGGRSANDECFNDVWVLRMQKDGKWEWSKLSSHSLKQPTGRYQVCSLL